MTSVMAGGVPFGTQIHLVAEDDPEGVGIIFAAEDGTDRQVRWRELDERSTQMAHVLVERGLQVGDHLAVCLRNSPEHLMVSFAGWKVGATVVPMRWDLPEWERGRVLAAIRPKVTIDAGSAEFFDASLSAPTTLLDEVVPPRGVGHLQLGVDRDTQGDRARHRGAVLPGGRGELRGGGLRRHARAAAGPGAGAAVPLERLHGDEESHGRRVHRAARTVQCRTDPRSGRAVPGDGIHRRHAHAPAPGPGARRRRGATSPRWTGSSRGPRRSPCGWAAAGAS